MSTTPTAPGDRVLIPNPDEAPLGLVLTCGSRDCRHTFEPDPIAFAEGSVACPACGGWTFQAWLVEPGTERSGAAGGAS